jgi:hypothetical protein
VELKEKKTPCNWETKQEMAGVILVESARAKNWDNPEPDKGKVITMLN